MRNSSIAQGDAVVHDSLECSCGTRFLRRLGHPKIGPVPCPSCRAPLVGVVEQSGGFSTHCFKCHWPEVRP